MTTPVHSIEADPLQRNGHPAAWSDPQGSRRDARQQREQQEQRSAKGASTAAVAAQPSAQNAGAHPVPVAAAPAQTPAPTPVLEPVLQAFRELQNAEQGIVRSSLQLADGSTAQLIVRIVGGQLQVRLYGSDTQLKRELDRQWSQLRDHVDARGFRLAPLSFGEPEHRSPAQQHDITA